MKKLRHIFPFEMGLTQRQHSNQSKINVQSKKKTEQEEKKQPILGIEYIRSTCPVARISEPVSGQRRTCLGHTGETNENVNFN